MNWDVVIAGAGPGGSVLAMLLARGGVRVLALEKKRLPRRKTCGGGLTGRALQELPYGTDEFINSGCRLARASYGGRTVYELKSERPIMNMVERDVFDHFLAQQAIQAGAVLREGVRFRNFHGRPGNIIIETSAGPLKARLVVGADGASSKVARVMGLWGDRRFLAAVEAETDPIRDHYEKQFAEFDFGVIPGGYGWVFPKRTSASAGLCTYIMDSKNLENNFRRYLEEKGVSPKRVRCIGRGLIPYRTNFRKAKFSTPFGLVIGDAAGMTDPITGEGLYFAFKQARLAAQSVIKALDSGPQSLATYDQSVRKTLVKDLNAAYAMSFVLYRTPWIGALALKNKGRRLGSLFLEASRGERTYSDLHFKMLKMSWLLPDKGPTRVNRC